MLCTSRHTRRKTCKYLSKILPFATELQPSASSFMTTPSTLLLSDTNDSTDDGDDVDDVILQSSPVVIRLRICQQRLLS